MAERRLHAAHRPLEPQLVRCPPAVPACRSREPASGERLGTWCRQQSFASRLLPHLTLLAAARRSSVQEASEATILALQLSKLGWQARQPRTAHAHHAHTLCTPCALRGHSCRLTRLRFCAYVSQGARSWRAWRAKMISRRFSFSKDRCERLNACC